MPLLEIRGVSCLQGDKAILRDVDLEVEPGEIHALLGPNGAGKSSLAYLLMGCEGYQPSSGRVFFDGRDLSDLPIHARARLGITLAWQEPARFEGLTVEQYIGLGGAALSPSTGLRRVGLSPRVSTSQPRCTCVSGSWNPGASRGFALT